MDFNHNVLGEVKSSRWYEKVRDGDLTMTAVIVHGCGQRVSEKGNSVFVFSPTAF